MTDNTEKTFDLKDYILDNWDIEGCRTIHDVIKKNNLDNMCWMDYVNGELEIGELDTFLVKNSLNEYIYIDEDEPDRFIYPREGGQCYPYIFIQKYTGISENDLYM